MLLRTDILKLIRSKNFHENQIWCFLEVRNGGKRMRVWHLCAHCRLKQITYNPFQRKPFWGRSKIKTCAIALSVEVNSSHKFFQLHFCANFSSLAVPDAPTNSLTGSIFKHRRSLVYQLDHIHVLRFVHFCFLIHPLITQRCCAM